MDTFHIFLLLLLLAVGATAGIRDALKKGQAKRESELRALQQAIKQHKKNLLKGGLIPRVEKSIHEIALSELGEEYPNRRLPKARYYNQDNFPK